MTPANKKKDRTKHSKKSKNKSNASPISDDENRLSEPVNYSTQLGNKLKWAVNEVR